jgi:hypothetical protein
MALLSSALLAIRKFALVLTLLLPMLVHADDALVRPGWRWRIWRTRANVGSTADSSNPKGERKLDEKFQPIAGNDTQFDAREWLRHLGVAVPDDGWAILDRASVTITLFAPNDAVDAAEKILGRDPKEGKVDFQIEVSLAECAVTSDVPLDGISYVDLRQAAGETWREREHITIHTPSGWRKVKERVTRKPPLIHPNARANDGSWVPMAAGDRGLQIDLEPVAGPAEVSDIDFNLTMAHRGPIGANGPVLDATLITTLTTWEDYPTVVAMWTVAPSKNAPELTRHVALVLQTHVIDSDATPKTPRK